MTWNEIESKWLHFKGEIKEQWGRLTNDDLDIIDGKREQLSAQIQRKYSIAKEEAEQEIDDFLVKERQEIR